MDNIIDFEKFKKKYNNGRYGVIKFRWGCGVKDLKKDKWTQIVFDHKHVLDVRNRNVMLYEGGILFLE
ncbi:MAG: hypothetical protein ACOCP4_07190 [Candidatus Woesearchaeota archaeon]